MPRGLTTREFRIDDYEAALSLWQRVEGLEIAEGDSRDEIAQFIERNPGLSRVAEQGGELVAIALCGHDGRRGHIYHLAVGPDYRGCGLAKCLVNECLGGLRIAGMTRAIILVADDNSDGRAFWKRCGWEQIDGAIAMGIDL